MFDNKQAWATINIGNYHNQVDKLGSTKPLSFIYPFLCIDMKGSSQKTRCSTMVQLQMVSEAAEFMNSSKL